MKEDIEKRVESLEVFVRVAFKQVLTAQEAAVYIGVGYDRIRALVAQREIPHYKGPGGRSFFKKSELDEWMMGERVLTNRELELKASTFLMARRRGPKTARGAV